MNKIKIFVKKYFSNFAFFYVHLRYRIFVILMLSIVVGLLDGLGLAMFLPLLEVVSNPEATVTSEQMGNLAFLIRWIENMGIILNLTSVLLIMLTFFSLKGLFKFLESFIRVIYQQFFMRNIRVKNIKALADFSFEEFVKTDPGRVQNTLSGEVGKVNRAFISYMNVMQLSVMIMVYGFLAFLANPEFAVLVFIGGLLTNLFFSKLYQATKILSRKLTKQNHGFQGLLLQQVSFFKYFKATGLINSYAKRLIDKVYQIEQSQRKIGILNAIMTSVKEPLLILVVVVIILVQVNFMGGSLSLIILSILFFYRALSSVIQLQTSWNSFLGAAGSLENLSAFIAELQKGREVNGKGKMDAFRDGIKLEDVSFDYGDSPVLAHISLAIPKNQTIAFVGESGSGKTTLINIITGLLKPKEGRLLVDGQDSRSLDMVTFQRRIGYITQEPVIFNDTVYNNVTFWDALNDENLKRFYNVLKLANIYDFVMDEARGQHEAMLGNNGINLSGGQRQRISIARELYKDVGLLIMDEATSSLDSETERNIQESIETLRGKYTIIIIAHRLSTIKNADKVVMLKNGRIEHSGTFKELTGESLSFRKMVELQMI